MRHSAAAASLRATPHLSAGGADRTVSFEAVLLAGAAQVSDVDDAALDADQLLRLTDVDPTAEIFADRPTRSAGGAVLTAG